MALGPSYKLPNNYIAFCPSYNLPKIGQRKDLGLPIQRHSIWRLGYEMGRC